MNSALLQGKSLHRRYVTMLAPLLAMFCLRVIGQLIVAIFHVPYLPPMEQWYSGLIPYPILLPCQMAIIGFYGKVCLDLVRGEGYFARLHPRLGQALRIFGPVYLAAMIIRYIVRMALYPQQRWTGGSIPIFFHWVLAAFLIVLGSFYEVMQTQSRRNVHP